MASSCDEKDEVRIGYIFKNTGKEFNYNKIYRENGLYQLDIIRFVIF